MEEIQDQLNLNQERFCQLYAKNSYLFGNATLAYAEAYDFDLNSLSDEIPKAEPNERKPLSEYQRAYNTCSVNASQLLRKSKIQDRVNTLLNELLQDSIVDAQLAKLIMSGDIQAIREYNKLRQRIVEKSDITTAGMPLILAPEILEKNGITTTQPNTGSTANSQGHPQV